MTSLHVCKDFSESETEQMNWKRLQNDIAETLKLTIKSDIHSQVSDGNISSLV